MAPRKNANVAPPAATATALLNSAMLAAVVGATQVGNPIMLEPSADATFLVDNGFITVDTSKVEDGKAPATATEKGINHMTNPDTNAPKTPPTEVAPSYEVETIPLAVASKRPPRANAAENYPFDKLAAPDGANVAAFFIPVTEARPEPWDSLGSTVSTASARYREKVGEKTRNTAKGEKTVAEWKYSRKFRIAEGDKTMPDGSVVHGAWVSRVV